MMNPYLYLRSLRSAEHSVFCVADGQKNYWDNRFNKRVAFSSGQQVKRTILESVLASLNESPAPVTFYFEGKKLEEKEVVTPGDPTYADQLLGGWMITKSGGNEKTIKRRSPLSISAMRPLHPLLNNIYDEKLSFDRSDKPGIHKVIVTYNNKELSEAEISELMEGSNRSLRRKYIQKGQQRTTGLFVYDVAIDLRTLFAVLTSPLERELSDDTIEKLKDDGWTESENIFGKCLVCPSQRREEIIRALAKGLINWRITSNQSRTFSLMETLAVAISNDANEIAGAIRAKLVEGTEKPVAEPIIDDTTEADLFITLPCDGYIKGVHGTANALKKAEEELADRLLKFDYENQINK